jgi:pimeloyl-ACP methyl ester carboxylesterase/UDP-N-acetylglucosamine:LPS N-acetylglucosamine transferase
MQVPYLAGWFRVIAWDPPGIGGGERTAAAAAFELDRVVDYGIGLLDHLGIDQADALGLSMGGSFGLWMAARHPERVSRLVLIGSVKPGWAYGGDPAFWERRDSYEGWDKRNAHYWREDYEGWLEFFFAQVCSEPHSTKGIDDFTGWAHETTPDILLSSVVNPALFPEMPEEEALRRVRCPVLLMHGTDDRIADITTSRRWAEARPDWALVELEESGHCPHIRDPVRVNLALAEFLGAPQPTRRSARRGPARGERRALFVSSPIGLGHIQRDLAIVRELRALAPELRIDWLAQHPVSRVLEEAGEQIHPASRELASESSHWEAQAGEHRLHCFFAWREMDEILLANFMVFLEAVRETPYDLWVGDEAWEVDYHLHENPELKTAPFAFLTDFLGWLPMSGGREAELTADYNAEMIEQVARYPRVRDRAMYLGDYEDLVPEPFGPGLPRIPDWAREHFTAVGYASPAERDEAVGAPELRRRLGYEPDGPLVMATVGGTAVGRHLLAKTAAAWPLIRAERPDARLVVFCGPRIDPETLPAHPGLEARPYVHDLHEHLACCDLGIAQGGLGSTMELALARRPFLYFPLEDHCEQALHVVHRLDCHGAGRRMTYATTSSESLAEAALATLGADTGDTRLPEPGAARRAAGLIAELL